MTVLEISYEVSTDMLSTIPGSMAEMTAAKSRPREAVFPVDFFDALRVKSATRLWCAVSGHLALAIQSDGTRDILGLWIEPGRATFWTRVFADLTSRGCQDRQLRLRTGWKA
jgi:putative transposase